jgi:predicted Zn-dependent peptidase
MHQEHVLSNGLRILMVPMPGLQSVSLGIFVRVGSRYEAETETGLCHFIEHMLFKGTSHRPTPKLVAEAIEGIGGLSDAYTDQETTVFYTRVAASQAHTAVHFLADLIRNPLFDPFEIEKERQVISEEISMIYDTPDDWVEVLLDQLVWPNHPLGQNVAGSRESIARLKRETLVSFFQRSYHPHNTLVAVAGAFESQEMIAAIAAQLGDWQPAPRPEFKPAPPAQTEPRCHIEHRSIEQGHLALALPGLSRTDPERYALYILNTILGDGMSSRLFQSIREDKGLAYVVESGLNYLQDTGTLTIYAGVDPERAAEALQAILDELERLRDEPIPAAEIRKAKEYLKGRLVLSLEDSYSQAAWVAYQKLFTDTIKSPLEVLAAYEAVTATEIRAVAEKLIKPTAYSLAAIGPLGRGGKALAKLVGNRN